MKTLAELERGFQRYVLEGEGDIERGVVGTTRFAVDKRLSIYFDAYRARLAEALESNYPVLAQLLGGEQFQDLAQAYVQEHRSEHFSIRWYGDRLPAFLTATAPYAGRSVLSELAHWEWQMTLAFDAADAPLLRRSALEGLAPEQWGELQFRFHPAVRILTMRTAAPTVWRALTHGEAPPQAALAPDAQADLTEERKWLIWRKNLDTYFRSLDAAEAAALEAVERGDSFDSICELLARHGDAQTAPATAAGLLARWLEDEMLAA